MIWCGYSNFCFCGIATSSGSVSFGAVEGSLHLVTPAPMGDYGWSMDSGTSQGSAAVEYGRVLEYPKKRNKSQTTRKPDLFR